MNQLTVEDFIASLEPPERVIMKRLRSLILESDPRIREKLSYGVPYFFHHRRICFLWPASHLPIRKDTETSDLVQLGFCYGHLLSNEQGLLLAENRKQVYLVKIRSLASIDENVIGEIVREAIIVDETFRKKSSIKFT